MANLIPQHVAIVMDGNGRWAMANGAERLDGHRRGAEVALDTVKYAAEKGIKYLTLYTFSSENWHRPKEEVQGLMTILYEKLLEEAGELVKNGVRLKTIGATHLLPKHVQDALRDVTTATKDCDRLTLVLALSYGSRDEIVRAAKAMTHAIAMGALSEDAVDENTFAGFLDTAFMPDPDVVVRTSGENRLSNFLLWQSSYAEIFFLKTLWPDFKRSDLDAVLFEFSTRERRFGRASSQGLTP